MGVTVTLGLGTFVALLHGCIAVLSGKEKTDTFFVHSMEFSEH
jgi:hypothetical protein